jgi:hypothetical protein
MEEAIGNIRINCEFLRSLDRGVILGSIFNRLFASVTCLKHEGFREEQEWRAIYCPNRNSSPLMEKSVEVIDGVPQTIYKLPLDASVSPILADLEFSDLFARLIIGPSPYPMVMYEAFVVALKNAGVKEAEKKVCISEIPIRS